MHIKFEKQYLRHPHSLASQNMLSTSPLPLNTHWIPSSTSSMPYKTSHSHFYEIHKMTAQKTFSTLHRDFDFRKAATESKKKIVFCEARGLWANRNVMGMVRHGLCLACNRMTSQTTSQVV